MKNLGFAAVLLSLALVAGNRAFGFSHDGMRPIGYTNIITPYSSDCSGYVRPCMQDIWAEPNGHCHHRCEGQAAGCSTCGAGVANSVISVEGALSNVNNSNGDITVGDTATEPLQQIRVEGTQAPIADQEVETSAPSIPSQAEKVEVSAPPAAGLTDDDDAAKPETATLSDNAQDDTAEPETQAATESTEAASPAATAATEKAETVEHLSVEPTTTAEPNEKAAAPNSEDKSADPADAKSSEDLLDAAPVKKN